MCTLFGLGSLATLALIYVGGTALNFGAVKLFKAGLAKLKASKFGQWLISKFPSLA